MCRFSPKCTNFLSNRSPTAAHRTVLRHAAVVCELCSKVMYIIAATLNKMLIMYSDGIANLGSMRDENFTV